LVVKEHSTSVTVVLAAVLIAVVGAALFGFVLLLVRDPDRLQSEEFLLRTRTLDIIEEKGSRKSIDAATQRIVAQDQFLELPESRDGGGR